MSKKKRSSMSAYTILFIIIIVVAAFTWIVPPGQYTDVDGVMVYEQMAESNPQGIYNILSAPIAGFFDAIDIALFVIVIGGFIGIVMASGAMEAGIAAILKKNKGKEHTLIPILMVLFAIGGTTYGMAEETIAFYPLIIPIFLAAGYDVVTAVMVIMLGAGVGVLGSTVNPFAIGVASEAAGIGLGEGLALRFVLWIVVVIAAIYLTMKYAKKVKEDPTKSIVADMREDNLKHFIGDADKEEVPEMTGRRKCVLALFGLSFVIMILGVIPWAYKFDILFFDNLYNALAKIKILGFEPNTAPAYWDHYDALKTQSAALGDWWFGQMTVLFFIMSIVIGKVAKFSEGEIVEHFIAGAKDLLGVALIVGMSRGIKVVMEAGYMSDTILFYGSESLKSLGKVVFVNLTYLFYIPLSFLVPSTSGLAGASIPIMGPMGQLIFGGSTAGSSLVITAFSAASGVVNLITPTSGVVMGGLAIARVPYGTWFKHVFKFLIALAVITMVILTIGAVMA